MAEWGRRPGAVQWAMVEQGTTGRSHSGHQASGWGQGYKLGLMQAPLGGLHSRHLLSHVLQHRDEDMRTSD